MTSASSDRNVIVVGIGASAGGFSAFSDLLSHLPDDTGMAFVLVQHLDPEQESLLSDLLGRTTSVPVEVAEDGVLVQANRVYVIPPGMQMTIAQRRLYLATCDQSRRRTKTIDLFFRSLAADQKNRAIAILLSGSNDDGALGIQEVRAAGGITFAQDRATAQFTEMPNAAIATGQVDFVLSPQETMDELLKISQHPYLVERAAPESDTDSDSEVPEQVVFGEQELSTLYQRLRKHHGVDFSQYKQTTFERRLRRRLTINKLFSLSDYIEYLQENPAEMQELYHEVLIPVTGFFRDADFYADLQTELLPTLLEQPSASSCIRVWVPGCATGEEVYSIAMCLLETLDNCSMSPAVQIFGTDINERAIQVARTGYYRETRMEDVSPDRRQRFFLSIDGGYQVSQTVRELCVFARQDLSSDPPFSSLDLVSCRNVLIYFKSPLQKRIMSIFHYSLKPTGFLALGGAEGVADTSDLFERFRGHSNIYARRDVPTRVNFDFVANYHPPDPQSQQQLPSNMSRTNVQQWADQMLLNRYAPVGVIVNEELEIIQFRGETDPYLRPPLGEPSFQLLKMIRPGLLVDLRTAIEEAKQQGIAVKRQDLLLDDASVNRVSLEVVPLNWVQGRCFLILFEQSMESEPARSAAAQQPTTAAEGFEERDVELGRLQQELAATRQELLDTQTFLQIITEEQEATHQQLIVANEEILSSNEELKSTNEELQTAKEEIQSANEELKTTNEELQHSNEEWHRVNNDLINLLNNVNIPILMLSEDLRIRSLTPAARSLLNLIPSDVGRSLRNFRLNINISDLDALTAEVIETLNVVEREVQDHEGRWYLLRIRPYRTLQNQINGVVLALVDIDNLKRSESELRQSQQQLRDELAVINRVQTLSLHLFSTLDIHHALHEVLDATVAMHDTNLGTVHLYDPAEDRFTLHAHCGFQSDQLDRLAQVWNDDNSSLKRSLKAAEQLVVENVYTTSEMMPNLLLSDALDIQGILSIPLIDRNGDLLGGIALYFHEPYTLYPRKLQLLNFYARQTAEFIYLVRVSERERQRLIDNERAAQEANARKDEFLMVLSHELRTPLNSVLGWIQMMEKKRLDASVQQKAIAAIKGGALNQLRLVEDLLDASHIIQGRFQLSPQPTDVSSLLHQAIATLQPQADAKSVAIETQVEPSSDLLWLDSHRLEQVFCNILSNSLKFTPSGGSITAQLTYRPDQVQVQIRDTGQGIAPDVMPHIFERFRQADASSTRRAGGLGLGLFLVRSIVEAHGGTVEAESPGLDQGTCMTITLPRIAVEPLEAEPSPLSRDNFLEGIRVLVVEDSADNVLLIQVILEELGAIVSTAGLATEALELLAREPQDLILSDIGLPEIDGVEFIRRLRSRPPEQGGQIPAIALTGYVSEQDVRKITGAGFQRFLAKPLNLEALVESIFSLIFDS